MTRRRGSGTSSRTSGPKRPMALIWRGNQTVGGTRRPIPNGCSARPPADHRDAFGPGILAKARDRRFFRCDGGPAKMEQWFPMTIRVNGPGGGPVADPTQPRPAPEAGPAAARPRGRSRAGKERPGHGLAGQRSRQPGRRPTRIGRGRQPGSSGPVPASRHPRPATRRADRRSRSGGTVHPPARPAARSCGGCSARR